MHTKIKLVYTSVKTKQNTHHKRTKNSPSLGSYGFCWSFDGLLVARPHLFVTLIMIQSKSTPLKSDSFSRIKSCFSIQITFFFHHQILVFFSSKSLGGAPCVQLQDIRRHPLFRYPFICFRPSQPSSSNDHDPIATNTISTIPFITVQGLFVINQKVMDTIEILL
eukprot:820809_1